MTPVPGCLVERCRGSVDPAAPLRLCERHLVVASEWVGRTEGVTDLLPSPCALCGSRVGVRWPSGWSCAVCEWRHGDVVDDELPPPRVDVVYYLRYDDRIKIGTTAHPRRRIAAIRHDELLAFERGDRLVERRRHERFAAERLGGTEWFRASTSLLRHVAEVAGGRDPWDAYARWVSEAFARRG